MTSKLYLTKRRNGYYYIGFFEGNSRKWKTTSCTTRSDALQFLRNFEGTKKEMERTPFCLNISRGSSQCALTPSVPPR